MSTFKSLGSINEWVASAAQMQAVEQTMFSAGMPVEALMEKASLGMMERIRGHYPRADYPKVGILVGTGHNGGDGLVIARELMLEGRQVLIWLGNPELKPLTASHARYLSQLRTRYVSDVEDLINCSLLIDALFGIGLSRPLEDPWAKAVKWANQSEIPTISVDLPSGMDTDTGQPQGSCVQADLTLCLGLWKRALYQDEALYYLGLVERVDIGIPTFATAGSFGDPPPRLLTPARIHQWLPPQPALDTYKYRQGHLLIIGGSKPYAGAIILTALGARPSGVGMTTVAVPESLKMLVHPALPEILVKGCSETPAGAIATLKGLDESAYTAIALGPGLTSNNPFLVDQWLTQHTATPLVLDADGLNSLAQSEGIEGIHLRKAATILTPHVGEFRRLFPDIDPSDRIQATQTAARAARAIVVLKGARTVIADPEGSVWINPESTPALARGGSGDVLTGLIGGLLAQRIDPLRAACLGVWWHSQAAIRLSQHRGLTGVDPSRLAEDLAVTLHQSRLDLGSSQS